MIVGNDHPDCQRLDEFPWWVRLHGRVARPTKVQVTADFAPIDF